MRAKLNHDQNAAQPQCASPLHQVDSLWLHGAGLSGDTWDSVITPFARATSVDLPGHGSRPALAPPSVEGYADALCDLVPAKSILVGHSLGGMVALELAARPTVDVRALVLIESVPTVRDRRTSRIVAQIVQALFRALPKSWLAGLTGQGQPPETRAELRRQIMRMEKSGLVGDLEAAAQYDGRPRLQQVDIPTLVIVSDANKSTHHGAALAARCIKNAELVQLPGGHMLHTDNPDQLIRCIEDFLLRKVLAH